MTSAGAGVGLVDPGVRAHEAVAGAADQPPAVGAHSSTVSSRIDLDVARVLAVLGGGARPRAPTARSRRARARALGLRDDLVGDGEHVGRPERGVEPRARGDEQGGEVVAGEDLRQAGEGVEPHAAASGRARGRAARAARGSAARRRAGGERGPQRLEVAGGVDVELERRRRRPGRGAPAAARAPRGGGTTGAEGRVNRRRRVEQQGIGARAVAVGDDHDAGRGRASNSSTSSASSAGQSPGTSSTRGPGGRPPSPPAIGRRRLPRLDGVVHHLDGRGAPRDPRCSPPPPRPRPRPRARARPPAPPARPRPSPRASAELGPRTAEPSRCLARAERLDGKNGEGAHRAADPTLPARRRTPASPARPGAGRSASPISTSVSSVGTRSRARRYQAVDEPGVVRDDPVRRQRVPRPLP